MRSPSLFLVSECSSISPGWINTDESMSQRVEEKAWHASGRIGKPNDVAEVVEFLLSHEDGLLQEAILLSMAELPKDGVP